MSHLRSVLLFVCLLVICQSAGLVGVLVMDTGRSAWYRSLPKPALNPPGWVFGPVWTILYALMAVAAFLIIRRGGRGVRLAMTLFAVQLLLNASWTPGCVTWNAADVGTIGSGASLDGDAEQDMRRKPWQKRHGCRDASRPERG